VAGELVGHILYPPKNEDGTPRPSRYIGRDMPRHELKDEGLGNPFHRWNSDDPVGHYARLLDGDTSVLVRLPERRRPQYVGLRKRLYLCVGRDLLCWCHKTPIVPGIVKERWQCHGEPLYLAVARWERANPVSAAAIRRALAA
jgi:hypothetical protein